MPRIGSLVVVDTRVWLTRCEPSRAVAWGAVARIGNRAVIDARAGGVASSYLGKTAGTTWVRCRKCVPPAPIRAASLSHFVDRTHIAIYPPFAIVSHLAIFVNTICVNIAGCNEISIAKCVQSGYNDCRMQ